MIGGSILYLWLAGLDMGTAAEQLLNGMYTSYILLAVPLFILAAELMNSGGMTERLLHFCDALVGRFRGGLAQVNVVQSIIFAGMSGSAIADAAGTGKMMQTMMTSGGKYTPSFAAALTAASSVIGPIIPPSIPMVIYALVSDASIGYLFLGGIIPGLLMGLAQMAIIALIARRRNFPVERPRAAARAARHHRPRLPGADDAGGAARLHLQRRHHADRGGGDRRRLRLPDLGAALSQHHGPQHLRLAPVERPHHRLDRHADRRGDGLQLRRHRREHPAVARAPCSAASTSRRIGFLILVNLLLLVLGCLLEGTTILLIVVPVLIPTAEALGIDLVHFGIVVVVNIMIGLITPPYGLLLFIMANISGAPLRDIVRDTLPFLFAMLVALALITFVPATVLWLPRLLGYQG